MADAVGKVEVVGAGGGALLPGLPDQPSPQVGDLGRENLGQSFSEKGLGRSKKSRLRSRMKGVEASLSVDLEKKVGEGRQCPLEILPEVGVLLFPCHPRRDVPGGVEGVAVAFEGKGCRGDLHRKDRAVLSPVEGVKTQHLSCGALEGLPEDPGHLLRGEFGLPGREMLSVHLLLRVSQHAAEGVAGKGHISFCVKNVKSVLGEPEEKGGVAFQRLPSPLSSCRCIRFFFHAPSDPDEDPIFLILSS